MTKEPTISEVLAGLAELEEAGRQAGAPADSISLFQRTRERIQYLGSAPHPGSANPEEPRSLAGPGELPDALAELIADAIEAEAPAWATNLLCTAHMRLASQLTADPGQTGANKRVLPRFEEDRSAHLIRASGTDIAARVVDRSPLGLGLLTEETLDPHELVRVRIEDNDPQDPPLGEVVFCQEQDPGSFHIGVELLASK